MTVKIPRMSVQVIEVHFRALLMTYDNNIVQEEGQRLAEKHGATFWEASASEDYYSTFRPLTSLIIKSFLKWKKGSTHMTASSSGSSSGAEDKCPNLTESVHDEEVQSLLRRYSEPTNNSSRLISSSQPQHDYTRKGSDDILVRNLNNSTSPIRNTIKRRKKLREFKSQSMDKPDVQKYSSLDKLTSKSASSSRSSTPTTPSLTSKTHDNARTTYDEKFPLSNITIEVTDTSNENDNTSTIVETTTTTTISKLSRNHRSQSLPKSSAAHHHHGSSRFIQRKGKGGSSKHYNNSRNNNNSRNTPSGIEKSHSLTDLKTLQYLSVDNSSSGMSSANSEMTLTSGESGSEMNTMGRRSNSANGLLGRSQSMRYFSNSGSQLNIFKSLSRSSSVRQTASAGRLGENCSKQEQEEQEEGQHLKSLSTSSFSSTDENKNGRKLWGRLRKDRHKVSTFPFEKSLEDSSTPKERFDENNGKLERVLDRGVYDPSKSMRRKISSIFRPKSINVMD